MNNQNTSFVSSSTAAGAAGGGFSISGAGVPSGPVMAPPPSVSSSSSSSSSLCTKYDLGYISEVAIAHRIYETIQLFYIIQNNEKIY